VRQNRRDALPDRAEVPAQISATEAAFWGTVESLSRLTNASSALANAVHA
jgi:hypothetical protein